MLSIGRSQASDSAISLPSTSPARSIRPIAASAVSRFSSPVGLAGSLWSRIATVSIMLATCSCSPRAAR